MEFRRNVGFLLVAFASMLVLGSCSSTEIDPGDMQTPDFILTDMEGETFQLSSTQGNVVMLHFFAPWCTVCQSEAPSINAIWEAYHTEGVVVVGVAVASNSRAELEAYISTFDVPYRVLIDDGRVSNAYQVRTVPKTYFLEKSGKIDRWFNGAISEEQMESVVQELLAAS